MLTFNIIISHIFPENFIEIPQIVWKIYFQIDPPQKKLLSKSSDILGLKAIW